MSSTHSDAIGCPFFSEQQITQRSRTAPPPRAFRIFMRAMGGFALAFTFFTLATVLVFWPWLAHLHTALIGPPEDNMQDFWNTWYAALAHDHGHFFATKLLRFPEGTSLVYQSFAYPQVFAVVALSRIFGTDTATLVALQNITLLASFPLAGIGAFYLVRHLVRNTFGSLIGGFVFSFNPSHVAQVMHHAHVSSIEFLPFFVLAYLLALERRSWIWLGAAAVFLALNALSCWYYLFYCAYFIGFHLLYQRVRDQAWPRGWQILAPTACVLSAVAILSPLLARMVMMTRPSVYDPGGNTYVADLLAYVAFPPGHMLSALSRGLYGRFSGYVWESIVYLGLVNLGALVWLCLRTGLARTSLPFYVLFGIATFALLASGEALHVAGAVTFIHLPDVVLDKLPFFANVRTPSRAIVFVYLFLGIGVGAAFAAAWREKGIAFRVGVAATTILMVLDFYPANLALAQVACPAGLAVLNTDREHDFGVLNLPFGYAEEDSYMLEQVCHRRPMMGGNTSRETGTTLINRLPFGSLEQQRAELTRAHVKYILLHRPRNGMFPWNAYLPPVSKFMRNYRVVYDGPDMAVLRVY